MSRNDEIKAVCTELEALLGQLQASVAALTAILTPPAAPDGQEVPVP